jgi:hypothetical protein
MGRIHCGGPFCLNASQLSLDALADLALDILR